MIRKPLNSSPLTGEDEGGGEKMDVYSATYGLPLPFIPSHQGRGKEFPDGH